MDLILLPRMATMVTGRVRTARLQAESGEFRTEARAEAARHILLLRAQCGAGPELLAQFENEDRNGRSVHQKVARAHTTFVASA